MNSKQRSYKPAAVVPLNIRVDLTEAPEAPNEFRARHALVQAMIAEMILLGRKRGRPVTKEVPNAKAA